MLGRLQEDDTNSLTADNLEKFGKLSAPPGPPDDGTLLSEAKLQSIMSFLDEMEKSGQDRPAPRREVVSRQAPGSSQREVTTCKAQCSKQSHSQVLKADRAAVSHPRLLSRWVTLSR